MMQTIDINCDVGEGLNNEALLLPFISSCNIACGAHAGNIEIIDNTIKLAKKHHVKIGAHPSYPDKENFGRIPMDLPLMELESSLIQQIKLMQERLDILVGEPLHHIKAHGALYNLSVTDKDIAKVIISAMRKTTPKAILYVPYQSVIATLASQSEIRIQYEAFADRNYKDDLSLVARTHADAVITDKEAVIDHLMRMINLQKVKSIAGNMIPIKAETYCVHGDNTAAVEIVKHIHQSITKKGF